MAAISAGVEGLLDEAVVRQIVRFSGHSVDDIHGMRGKDYLTKNLLAYNELAKTFNFLLLRDLDTDAVCAPMLVATLLPAPSAGMHFRVAVREVEAWLLGDPATLGRHLKIARAHLPNTPENLLHPKRSLVDACEHSSSRAVKQGMIPRGRSGRSEGDEYTSILMEFVLERWNIEASMMACRSLEKCVSRLRAIP